MNAMTTGATVPAQTLTPGMFTDFVTWIDRTPKTTQTYIRNLRQFAAWMKYSGITQPIRADIISYRDWLGVEHDGIRLSLETPTGWEYRTNRTDEPIRTICSPNTVAQYLRSVRQFFRWTAAEGLYPDIAQNIHGPKIRHSRHRKDALEPEDVRTIEKSIEEKAAEHTQAEAGKKKDTAGRMQRSDEQGKRLKAMYLLAVTAGLRVVELSRANVKDFEEKGGQAWLFVQGKGHVEADQKKAVAPEVAAAIKDYLQTRTDNPTGTSPLFVSTGNRSKGKRIAPTTISKMLKQAMKEAGYNSDRITAHSLRHTAGTNAMKITGNNIYEVQQYMRHADPATTEIYINAETDKEDASIAQQLYELYTGEETNHAERDRLQSIIERMNPQQIEQLSGIAEALAG